MNNEQNAYFKMNKNSNEQYKYVNEWTSEFKKNDSAKKEQRSGWPLTGGEKQKDEHQKDEGN